jgi:hypothetical protein
LKIRHRKGRFKAGYFKYATERGDADVKISDEQFIRHTIKAERLRKPIAYACIGLAIALATASLLVTNHLRHQSKHVFEGLSRNSDPTVEQLQKAMTAASFDSGIELGSILGGCLALSAFTGLMALTVLLQGYRNAFILKLWEERHTQPK